MLKVQYKKYGIIRLSHLYFPDANALCKKYKGSDLIYIHGVPENAGLPKKYLIGVQNTLVKDLDLDQEQLFLTLGKHLRAHIKRSIRDEEAKVVFYTSQEILNNSEILKICCGLFEKMYLDKGIKSRFNFDLARTYCKSEALVIAMAYHEDVPIGFSAVIYNGEYARLWLAAFDFRNNEQQQLYSRAHMRLDWELILWCKNHGVKHYDFGGVYSFDGEDGISQFKLAFERENKVTYENYLIPCTLLGKLVYLIKIR